MPARVPSYRLHKSTGQAVVTIGKRDLYLGKHGSETSKAEYRRLIAELAASRAKAAERPTKAGANVSVMELMLEYVRFADGYYQKNGRPTGESDGIRLALRPLKKLYGHVQVIDFGPLKLKRVRQEMIDGGLCRNEVNKRTAKIVRMFRWGVESEIVPADVYSALKAVAGLREGRSKARETEKVVPVDDATVERTIAHLPRLVAAMVRLQRHSGMRPGEICLIRTSDLNMSGSPWVFTPAEHKTQHHGKTRRIALGPKAQAVLRPWLPR